MEWPEHKMIPHKIMNMHEINNQIIDPYHWLENVNESQQKEFLDQENTFTRILLSKYDFLEKQILRELEFYKETTELESLRINEYVYYRRLDNPADSLSIYRFPLDELEKYGFKEG